MMPYPKEVAGGESLIWLENSQALKDFEGEVLRKDDSPPVAPARLNIARRGGLPRRVIAIDGSNIVHRINNGFPGAETGLVMVSVIAVRLDMLRDIVPGEIPRASIFHNMERADTVQAALPGIGVVQKGVENDSPAKYFRRVVRDTLAGAVIAKDHESLLDTLRGISGNFSPRGTCPGENCDAPFDRGDCCPRCGETLYETDILRLHEYFDEIRTSGEAHGRFRSVLEILMLLNILRYFADKRPAYFADCVFAMDGPLAIFGAPASLLKPIRKELLRLNKIARAKNGSDIALLGVEKSGAFYEHWEQIDWDEEKGPRTRYSDGAIIAPDAEYIRSCVIPGAGKPHGEDTHFGRYVLYKTNKGEHVVLNTAMLNNPSQDFRNVDAECYPRLGDILDVMDQLATHLYRDGFMPLVRAHANAAIPLKRGADIIQSLFDES